MGLDQYLYASRRFDPASEDAQRVLDAAGVSLAELRDHDQETDYDASIYLPMWDHVSEVETSKAKAVEDAAGLMPLLTSDSPSGEMAWDDGAVVVRITCAYWRKANAVHAWFVDRCQGGVDECQISPPISAEQLAQLRADCQKALEAFESGDHKTAGEIMAPRPGFFFGSYDIDEGWASDMKDTIVEIERVVNTAASLPGSIEFAYHSSW